MTRTASEDAATATADGASLTLPQPSPSIRSLLLKELARRRDAGEDIASRKISAVLAREFGCSRALVIGARRTVLASQHTRAFDELRLAFGASAPADLESA